MELLSGIALIFIGIVAVFTIFSSIIIFRLWLRGLGIWRGWVSKMLSYYEKEDGSAGDKKDQVKEEKESKGSNTGLVLLALICLVYYLVQYILNYYLWLAACLIFPIILTLLYCYQSYFCKNLYSRLFLVILGYIGYNLALYYYDFVILTFDYYVLANINMIAYYILKILMLFNLVFLIYKGIQGLLHQFFHKIDIGVDEFETLLHNYIDNTMKYNKGAEERIRESGEEGEANVRYALKWLVGYRVLHNVRVPNPLESQEIDHIVIGRNGVFHLETKNHGGKYGAKITINKEGDWCIEQNGAAIGMTNPLFQVRRHERVLREFLVQKFPQLNIPIKEIVVLSNEKTILEGAENSPITVLKIERLNDYITNYESPANLDENAIQSIYNKLAPYAEENYGKQEDRSGYAG